MANAPYDDRTSRGARSERSVGEHIFIWVAWALAAAFWGASLTTMVEIFRTATQATTTISAPGAPGGLAYLILVVGAFLALALALAYGSIRSATSGSGATREAATAEIYRTIDRQGGEDMTSRSPDRRRQEPDFR